MPDDPNVVPKSAVLQSITAEANGFYGVVVTVASTFLGGSLLFLEKFAPARNSWSIVVMALGWFSLVASIGCIARIRFMNLRSGKLALLDRYDAAMKIDQHTDMLSNWSQWLLIGGMLALVIMGVLSFRQITKEERKESMSNQNSGVGPLDKSIPYGSLKPNTPAPVSQTPPPQGTPANSSQPPDVKK
jgi:amino acid transporter